MKLSMTEYRFGLIIGTCAAWGAYSLFEGLEVLIFGGLIFPWNTRNALLAVGFGLLYVGLAYLLHKRVRSIQRVAETKREAHNG